MRTLQHGAYDKEDQRNVPECAPSLTLLLSSLTVLHRLGIPIEKEAMCSTLDIENFVILSADTPFATKVEVLAAIARLVHSTLQCMHCTAFSLVSERRDQNLDVGSKYGVQHSYLVSSETWRRSDESIFASADEERSRRNGIRRSDMSKLNFNPRTE